MNLNNHHKATINYGEPFIGSWQRRRRRLVASSYNDRSPDVSAMNAHLRASAYREGESASSSRELHDRDPRPPVMRTGSFAKLLREYDTQARDNFAKEAVLFAIIILTPFVWPVVQGVQALGL